MNNLKPKLKYAFSKIFLILYTYNQVASLFHTFSQKQLHRRGVWKSIQSFDVGERR